MYSNGNYIFYKEPMNLREKPNAASKLLAVVPQGMCVTVEETKDNWGKIQYEGKAGWCCISECFAQKVCACENHDCCYYEKYRQIEQKYENLIKSFHKIEEILRE